MKDKKPVVWKETVGYLNPMVYRGGKITYYAPYEKFEVSFNYKTDFVDDVKYSMRYNVNDPNEIEIDYWNQVFLEGETTSSTVALITSIDDKSFLNWKGDVVNYHYYVGDKKFEKWAYLHPDFRKLNPNLAKGQCYRLEYWDENVHRNKLHLENPMNCDSVH